MRLERVGAVQSVAIEGAEDIDTRAGGSGGEGEVRDVTRREENHPSRTYDLTVDICHNLYESVIAHAPVVVAQGRRLTS
jgi:hypothetical protein